MHLKPPYVFAAEVGGLPLFLVFIAIRDSASVPPHPNN